jgi:hypothetical protein
MRQSVRQQFGFPQVRHQTAAGGKAIAALLEQARKTWHCTKLQGLISHGPCRLDGVTEIGLRHFRLTQLETPFTAAVQRAWVPELLLRVRGERFVEGAQRQLRIFGATATAESRYAGKIAGSSRAARIFFLMRLSMLSTRPPSAAARPRNWR